jgi:hypothetical protein
MVSEEPKDERAAFQKAETRDHPMLDPNVLAAACVWPTGHIPGRENSRAHRVGA